MIRPAQRDDAARVADLWNQMIRETLFTFTTEEKPVAEVENLLRDRAGAFWVAELENSVVGFVTYGAFRGGPGYRHTVEHTVIVGAAAQGKGIGGRLLDAACDGAARAGKRVMIAGISGANSLAMRFHARHGFHETGRLPEVGYKAGQWLDLVLMQKNLTPTRIHADTPDRAG